MIKLRLSVILLLSVLMTGCGEDKPTPPLVPSYAEKATVEQIGMSLHEIFTCLGAPASKTTAGMVETWTYNYGSCTVNMTVEDGTVKDSDFTAARGPDAKTWDEQCESIPEVASCVRWLRH